MIGKKILSPVDKIAKDFRLPLNTTSPFVSGIKAVVALANVYRDMAIKYRKTVLAITPALRRKGIDRNHTRVIDETAKLEILRRKQND